ncbi:hypothetical protein GCM10022255_044530 [Dactylosporangium darangshiense]|uniref:Uncharacterized protein n=1 Tax=Dactylosporangium darangshiense TaxID=579108 RepID=A0ABP8DAU2_9ACTN
MHKETRRHDRAGDAEAGARHAAGDQPSFGANICLQTGTTYVATVYWTVNIVPHTVVKGFQLYDSRGNVRNVPSLWSIKRRSSSVHRLRCARMTGSPW